MQIQFLCPAHAQWLTSHLESAVAHFFTCLDSAQLAAETDNLEDPFLFAGNALDTAWLIYQNTAGVAAEWLENIVEATIMLDAVTTEKNQHQLRVQYLLAAIKLVRHELASCSHFNERASDYEHFLQQLTPRVERLRGFSNRTSDWHIKGQFPEVNGESLERDFLH